MALHAIFSVKVKALNVNAVLYYIYGFTLLEKNKKIVTIYPFIFARKAANRRALNS